MLVLIGASASGKTEVAKILIKNFGYSKIITNTTRPKRPGEIDGKDYHFHSIKQFKKLKREHFFIETAIYDDNYYGTALQDVKQNSILIVEPTGANNIIDANVKETVIIFFDASEETRIQRMRARGDHENKIKDRIEGDRDIFVPHHIKHIDYIVETNVKTQYEIAEDIHQLYTKELAK